MSPYLKEGLISMSQDNQIDEKEKFLRDKCRLVSVEEMLELENYHFVSSS
jgi:hypothetical protein